MKSGELNRFVSHLRNVQTGTTELNEPIFELVEQRTFRAALIYLSEDEGVAASQVYASRVVTFRCRYFSDLLASDTLRCEGVDYNIKGWRQLGLRTGLEISATAAS